jgi:hypothetical protein
VPRWIRSKLTYANVVATLALFLSLAGGAVYAANKIRTNDIARNAVKRAKIAPNAVRAGKIAKQAVVRNRIRDNAITSAQVKARSIEPSDLAFPVSFVATQLGGSLPVSGSFTYPLVNNTWTQQPGQVNLVIGRIQATLAWDGVGGGSCDVSADLQLNGQSFGGGQFAQVTSTSPTPVVSPAIGLPPGDPDVATPRELTLNFFASNCAAGSTIDRVRLRVLEFGG